MNDDQYGRYQGSPPLGQALQEDVALRFPPLALGTPEHLAHAVVQWLAQVADSRNLARFECSQGTASQCAPSTTS